MASTVRMNQEGWTMIRDLRFFRSLWGETEEARWAPGRALERGRSQAAPPLRSLWPSSFQGRGGASVGRSPRWPSGCLVLALALTSLSS